jgi:molybdopterin-guanine dinucleotide biosynthesis protein A
MSVPLGVILAGGQARRMGGGDKALLLLDGQTLLARVVARMAPQVDKLALNANGDPARFQGFDLPVIADNVGGFVGPLAGVLAGLDWAASEGASHIVTAAADTPFFPADLVARLQAALSDSAPIAMAATPDPKRGMSRHPTFGLWPVALRDDLRAALNNGTRKVIDWTDQHGVAHAEFSVVPYDPFFNVNTPEDMLAAIELLERAKS